jgi:diaminopimelate decarboxylase
VDQPFWYKKREMYCEDVPVAEIARKCGTPLYLYSQSALMHQYRTFDEAFAPVPHLICYAVKANSNLAILSLFRALGSGFDVVSGGELMRAFAAGMDPKRIIFSGVGKTVDEIDLGLRRGILQFNIESVAELGMVAARAQALGRVADIALRVNPDVDPRTHPYISTGAREHKFGIAFDQALQIYRRARRSRHLRITGVACHIGSQITTIEPFLSALERLKEIFRCLHAEGVNIRNLDLGGGLGIVYDDELPPHPAAYAQAVVAAVRDLDCRLLLEPGRVIAGNAGILVTRVIVTKQNGAKNFVVVDAGMNDLIRPSLYGSHHRVQAVTLTRRAAWKADIVGPICESGDFLARDRNMTVVKAKELLAIMSAGAYGFVLSSNYNTRARAAEVLVRGSRIKIIRRRERFPELIRGEALQPL